MRLAPATSSAALALALSGCPKPTPPPATPPTNSPVVVETNPFSIRIDATKLRGLNNVALTERNETNPGLEKVQTFLTRFGYLKESEGAAGVLDAPTSQALKLFQRFNGRPVTGAFDEATRKLMLRPRCGFLDRDPNTEQPGPPTATLECRGSTSLRIAFDRARGSRSIPGDGEFDAVWEACQTWQRRFPNCEFTKVGLNENPHVVVSWVPTPDADMTSDKMIGPTIAHTDYQGNCQRIPVDHRSTFLPIHFDDTEVIWTLNPTAGSPEKIDVETVALHELGHVLGLGHSLKPEAVMRPTVLPNVAYRGLKQDDIDGITQMYGYP